MSVTPHYWKPGCRERSNIRGHSRSWVVGHSLHTDSYNAQLESIKEAVGQQSTESHQSARVRTASTSPHRNNIFVIAANCETLVTRPAVIVRVWRPQWRGSRLWGRRHIRTTSSTGTNVRGVHVWDCWCSGSSRAHISSHSLDAAGHHSPRAR